MVHGDRKLPGRCLRQTPARVGVGLGGKLDLLLARGTHPPGEPLRRQVGLRGAESPGAGPDEDLRPQSAELPRRRPRRRPGRAGEPLSVVRRWWASKAAATRGSSGSAGIRSTRPTTDRVSSTGHPAPAQTVTSPASSSPVSRSSSAEAVMRVASARSPGCSRVMSDCLVSTVTAAPSAAGPGRSAAATSSRSASRSCTTQCCGPGSSGASQRPIAPVPQPRSWITRRPVAGRCRRSCSTRSGARAAASAGSRRASHLRLTRMSSTVIATPRPGHLRRRTWWSTTRRATRAARGRPGATALAARRRRARPGARRRAPQGRRAGPAARAGSRRRRDRGPPVSPPTSAATTGRPRASASVTTMPYVSARDASTSTSAAA